MKTHNFLIILLLLSIYYWGNSQQITIAEYFIDSEPGIGNGIPFTIVSGDTIVEIEDIPTTGLTQGFHTIFFRFRDVDNHWSLSEGRRFYIQPDIQIPEAPSLATAEYFFDSDPGIGNGTAFTLIPGDTLDQTFSMPLTGLSEGFHSLFIRFKDDGGHWSLYEGRRFYVQPYVAIPPVPPIASAEYFFDTEPGVGNGIPLILNPDDTVHVSWSIPVIGLENGLHYLYIRTADEEGEWSLSQRDSFNISNGLQLKVFFEGPFSGTGMNTSLNPSYLPLSQPYNTDPWNYLGNESVPGFSDPDIVDWVLVELRETTGDASTALGDSIVAQQAAFIKKDGSVVAFDGNEILAAKAEITDNLYSVIWHRNHLGVMSANPLTETDGTFSYDYSEGSDKVFGGIHCHKELVPGLWGMIAGDGDKDGQVDNKDKNDILLIQIGNDGYLEGDFDMNGTVSVQDKLTWELNPGRATKIPE